VNAVELPAVELARLMRRTWPHTAGPGDHPQLRVVRLEWDGATLHAVATNRFRLAWARHTPPAGAARPAGPWAVHLPAEHARALAVTWWQIAANSGECANCGDGVGCCASCPEHAYPAQGPALLAGPDDGWLVVEAPAGQPGGRYRLAEVPDPARWPASMPDSRRHWRDLFHPSATEVQAGRAVAGAAVAAFADAYGEPCMVRFTELGPLLRLDIEDDYTGLIAYQHGGITRSLAQP